MGASNGFINNVRIRPESQKGQHGMVIACYIDTNLLQIIGVSTSRVEIFNAYNGQRLRYYTTTQTITCSHYDPAKQLITLGHIKGTITALTITNLKVIVEMPGNDKSEAAISAIYEINNTILAGFSNGIAKKLSLDYKELAYYSFNTKKKYDSAETIEFLTPYSKIKSSSVAVRNLKVSHKNNRMILAFYNHFTNEEGEPMRVLNNTLCIFDYETGKPIDEIPTSDQSILSMELLERNPYCLTLEGDQNNVYLYDYVEATPLLKFNLSLTGIMQFSSAVSLHVIENSSELLTQYKSNLRLLNTGDIFILGFNNGNILSSTYKVAKGEQLKLEMEWNPQYLFKHKETLENLQKVGYNPQDFSISSLHANPDLDVCLGGDHDGNIVIVQSVFSGILCKDPEQLKNKVSFFKKIKEGIPLLWSKITKRFTSSKKTNINKAVELENIVKDKPIDLDRPEEYKDEKSNQNENVISMEFKITEKTEKTERDALKTPQSESISNSGIVDQINIGFDDMNDKLVEKKESIENEIKLSFDK